MGSRSRTVNSTSAKIPDVSASNPNKMSSESRRLRNRLSQKAFRARQAMRIKELEERLDLEPISDAARTAQLNDRNAALRNQLLDCHKKITSLQISMKTLAESTALALGLNTLEDSQPKVLCSHCQRPNDSEDRNTPSDEGYSSRTPRSDLEQLEEDPYSQPDSDFHSVQMPDTDHTMGGATNVTDQSLSTEEPHVRTIEFPEKRRTFLGHDQERIEPPVLNLDFGSPSNSFDSLSSGQRLQTTGSGSNNDFIPIPQIPLLYSFDVMGFAQYADLVDRCPLINPCSQLNLRRTNSVFSDHLSAVEYFLQQKLLRRCPNTFSEEKFTESIKFMISAFVSVSWPTMTAWHTYTKAHVPLKDLTAWRVMQTPEAYMKIIPSYRPTKLQMSTQHPAIIDWIPWSNLRDKLIIYHSANPCLDDIICDIGNSYVVPADVSKLVAGFPAMIGYISVWDLVRAIAPDATSPDCDSSSPQDGVPRERSNSYFSTSNGTGVYNADAGQSIIDDVDDEILSGNISLPAPDTNALFGSRALAIQAFKALGMDKGAANFCLDPEFFGRHPELYDPQCDNMARGVPLRPNNHLSMPIPRELNSCVLGQYRELLRWASD